jgi:hypothetical protein
MNDRDKTSNIDKNENYSLLSSFSTFLRPDSNRREIFTYIYKEKKKQKRMIEPLPEVEKLQEGADNLPKNVQENGDHSNNTSHLNHSDVSDTTLPIELSKFKEKTPLYISITVNCDSEVEIEKLRATLKSIEGNFTQLTSELGILPENLLIFILFENILEKKNIHYLFPGLSDDQITLEEESRRQIFNCNTLFYDFSYKTGEQVLNDSLNIICVFKKNVSKIEAQKIFLMGLCPDLSKPLVIEGKATGAAYFSLFLDRGIILERSALVKMIHGLTYTHKDVNSENFSLIENENFAVKGQLRPVRLNLSGKEGGKKKKGSNFYSLVQEYDYFHYFTYDEPYNSATSSCDLDNRFCMFKINSNTFNLLSDYYSEIRKEQIDSFYNNKLLPLKIIHSPKNLQKVKTMYLPDCYAEFDNSNLKFTEMMEDYTDRTSASLRVFFTLISSIFTCRSCTSQKILNNLINIMKIFSTFISFILPGLFIFVIYTIFFEAFGSMNMKATFFFTILYAFFILVAAFYSLIFSNPRKDTFLFHILHYIFWIFYVFIILCSIVATDKVRVNDEIVRLEGMLGYRFNVPAITLIILLNFLFAITPLILNFKVFKGQIINMFAYLVGGSSSYTSLFLVYSIFNAYKNKNANTRASLITIFLISNIFFGWLIFLLDRREQRVNSILGLAVIFTIYIPLKKTINICTTLKYKCFTTKYFNTNLSENLRGYFSFNYPCSKPLSSADQNEKKKNYDTSEQHRMKKYESEEHSGLKENAIVISEREVDHKLGDVEINVKTEEKNLEKRIENENKFSPEVEMERIDSNPKFDTDIHIEIEGVDDN